MLFLALEVFPAQLLNDLFIGQILLIFQNRCHMVIRFWEGGEENDDQFHVMDLASCDFRVRLIGSQCFGQVPNFGGEFLDLCKMFIEVPIFRHLECIQPFLQRDQVSHIAGFMLFGQCKPHLSCCGA